MRPISQSTLERRALMKPDETYKANPNEAEQREIDKADAAEFGNEQPEKSQRSETVTEPTINKPKLADVAERIDPINSPDHGERAEVRQILARTNLTDYVRAAAAGGIPQGAASELNAAFNLPVGFEVQIPMQMLLRAATTTTQLDGPEMQRPVLPRLFEGSLSEFLGVRMDAVQYGKQEWPLLATGATAATVAEGADSADPAAATFTTVTLKPNRYQTSLSCTQEMKASVGPGLEPALRMDMQNAVMDLVNDAILSGSGTAPQGDGLEHRLTRPARPDDTVIYTDVGGIPSKAVDAIHASDPSQVRVLIGLKTLEKLESLYRDGVGENAYEVLQRRSGGVRVSAKINPPLDSSSNAFHMAQDVFLYAAGDGMRSGDSVCAMWPSIELIRDNVTKAKSGTIILTLTVNMDFHMALRKAAYKRLTLKLA